MHTSADDIMEINWKSVLIRVFMSCLLVLLISVQKGESGECCQRYYDRLGFRRNDIWCPDYCCSQRGPYTYRLYCCSDFTQRARYGLRGDFCPAWFTHPSNIWVPILIGIIALAILIGLCGCCFCFCC